MGNDKLHKEATGFYELRPYYQKMGPLNEKANYAIQWCTYRKEWQLIKINPLGDFPLNDKKTNIAPLLKGEKFSQPTNVDIKAYNTFENLKSVVKTFQNDNNELNQKIFQLQLENARLNEEKNLAKEKMISSRKENKSLYEKLDQMYDENAKLKENFEEIQKEQKIKTEEFQN